MRKNGTWILLLARNAARVRQAANKLILATCFVFAVIVALPAGATAQVVVANIQFVNVVNLRSDPAGCLVLVLDAIQQTGKLANGAPSPLVPNFKSASFFVYRAVEQCDAETLNPSETIATGSTDQFQLTIDSKLTNGVLQGTIPTDPGSSFAALIVNISFQGITGQLSPFRGTQTVSPGLGGNQTVVAHVNGYTRPAQMSGTALGGGVDFIATPFSSTATLTVETIRFVQAKNLLLR